ncbi:MAG: hypothetical protein LBN25_05320, partial [Christensenellaceae bacterium]|nr:hypothetical protein [Christensenellaceae bacterium]
MKDGNKKLINTLVAAILLAAVAFMCVFTVIYTRPDNTKRNRVTEADIDAYSVKYDGGDLRVAFMNVIVNAIGAGLLPDSFKENLIQVF